MRERYRQARKYIWEMSLGMALFWVVMIVSWAGILWGPFHFGF
jgi:hypothetical protein